MSFGDDGHKHLFQDGICAVCNQQESGACRNCGKDPVRCDAQWFAAGFGCCLACDQTATGMHEATP